MISERTLKQWRKDALKIKREIPPIFPSTVDGDISSTLKISQQRILLLTQELMDLHLIRKEK
jgi:hypothetical protein